MSKNYPKNIIIPQNVTFILSISYNDKTVKKNNNENNKKIN